MDGNEILKITMVILVLAYINGFREINCCSKQNDNESMKQVGIRKQESDPRLKLNDNFIPSKTKKPPKVRQGNFFRSRL